MAKKETKKAEDAAQETAQAETAQQPEAAPQQDDPAAQLAALQAKLDQEHDAYLRLAAEYDNFRKRSQKEKDSLYQDAKTDTVSKILPVFDNLERAVNQPTEDEAYKKGVEMTMSGLREVMSALGVTEFGEAGDAFDPNMHNAVMHIEDESLGENVIAQVFQKGFKRLYKCRPPRPGLLGRLQPRHRPGPAADRQGRRAPLLQAQQLYRPAERHRVH